MSRTLFLVAVMAIISLSCRASNQQQLVQDLKAIESVLLPSQYLLGHEKPLSIPEFMLRDGIPGVSMVLINETGVVWKAAYGYADLNSLKPVTEETVFVGASLSKPFAATAALQLVDRGVVDIDANVNRYLKSWKVPENEFTKERPVTLRQLIGHRAGVKNFVWTSYALDEPAPTLKQLLQGEAPSHDPSVEFFATPGRQYKYANPGYTIIGQLIEDVTGQGFEAIIDSAIFEPLGMAQSSFSEVTPKRFDRVMATGYSKQLQPYPELRFPFKPAGGIRTTPTDLAKFLMTLINDHHNGGQSLLSQAITKEMFARNQLRLGFSKHFNESSDDLVFDHWGSNAGFTSYMVGSLKDKQALVIMTNSDNGFDLMAAIARTVAQRYGWAPIKPHAHKPVQLSANELRQFTGQFGTNAPDNKAIEFTIEENTLFLQEFPENNTTALTAIADRKFLDPNTNTSYEFIEDESGAIAWVRTTRSSGYNFDRRKQTTLSNLIEGRLEQSQIAGLAIAVIKDGKVTFQENFGVTNRRSGQAINEHTLFEAASLSKPVFAYFVLQQVHKGVIELDRPLYTYWPHPDLADDLRHKKITARMILTHTSGLPNWRADYGGELSLLFEPGAQFHYSGEGFEYLRRVLQHELDVDDQGLQRIFDEEVAKQTGAKFMKYTWDRSIPERKSFGHINGKATDNHKHDHNFGAAYSLTTTVSDYAQFVSAILRPKTPEQQAIAKQMLAVQTNMPHKPKEMHRSLGFALTQTKQGFRYFHSGNNGDFRAYVHFYPASGNGLVLFSNSDQLFSSGLAKEIVEFLGDEWHYIP